MIDVKITITCDACYYSEDYCPVDSEARDADQIAQETRAQVVEDGWKLGTGDGDLCLICATGRGE